MTTTPESKAIEAQHVQPSPDGFHPRTAGRIAILVAAAAFAALALLIYSGIHSRAAAESRLKQRTEEAAIPTVAVVFPKEGAPTQEIVLPGNTQAFSDAPIYARTSGYLKRWYFDIGAHVQKDQLLAQIETPEVDQQLQQARADLQRLRKSMHPSTASSPPAIRTSGHSSMRGPAHSRGNSFTSPQFVSYAFTSPFPRCIPVPPAPERQPP